MLDLAEIRDYSIEHFGEEVAARYINSIQESLLMLEEHPSVLKGGNDSFSEALFFYPTQRHHLVCTVIDKIVIVLTVTHCQMDLISKLRELEPALLEEAKILFESLQSQ